VSEEIVLHLRPATAISRRVAADPPYGGQEPQARPGCVDVQGLRDHRGGDGGRGRPSRPRATPEPGADGHSAPRDRRDRGARTATSRAGHSRDSHHGHDRVRDDRGSAEDHGRRI